jgi:hypothetical protein
LPKAKILEQDVGGGKMFPKKNVAYTLLKTMNYER